MIPNAALFNSNVFRVLFKNKFDVEERIPHTTELPENLHQCEFFIVELMNKLRQLLWPPAGGDAELHLTKIYPQVSVRQGVVSEKIKKLGGRPGPIFNRQ